jgi:small subunit ribosomal protein S21
MRGRYGCVNPIQMLPPSFRWVSGYYRPERGWLCVKVEMRDNESFDALLRRFTKDLQSSGVLREYRSKRRFVSKSEQRRAKMRKAEHKRRRKIAKVETGGRY